MKYLITFLIGLCFVSNVFASETQIIVKLKQPKQLKADYELSALGMRFHDNNYQIYYVDSNSYLYGTVFTGDFLVSIDGENPLENRRHNHNFGDANTPVNVVINRHGQYFTIMAYRRPVRLFGPVWHQTGNY